ncbi:hypothetical protein HYV79_02690 [Candidatus Woesearchaeota archaeon]|nr:hypothetical protein [Candidatus Woesearchaeota archaeon]
MDWIECKEKRIAKEVFIDEDLINSLIKSSKKKIKSEELLPLNETTTESKITLAYDGLRELLEALALSKKFKIYNHECYGAFLKEIVNLSEVGDDFDEIRKIRNAVNYYGKQISKEECVKIILQIKEIIKKVKSVLTCKKLQKGKVL